MKTIYIANLKKKIITAIIFCYTFTSLSAQYDTANYLSNHRLPSFTLLNIDSIKMTREDLSPNKKVLVIFFSTDCEVCHAETKTIIENIDRFKEVQILLVTFQPFSEMVNFNNKYNLQKYPNIRIGRDYKYFFPGFYEVTQIPFLALYNKEWELIKTFSSLASADTILEGLKE